jgi:ribonuclease P protein component
MNQIRETFTKSERLCSRKAIAGLFEDGNSFFSYPFQVVWMISNSDIPFPAQVAISVSKRGFKLAVTRNLIRRRIKEVYRKNKQILYDALNTEGKKIIFIIIFKAKSVPDFSFVEKSMKELLSTFAAALKEPCAKC